MQLHAVYSTVYLLTPQSQAWRGKREEREEMEEREGPFLELSMDIGHHLTVYW